MRNTGIPLEDEVFAILQRLIESDGLPYKSERCQLHRRKAYYSPDRQGLVNFENVIEVFRSLNRPSDSKPAHVVFYECKDHGRNVEVGEIDEVCGRLGVSFGFSMKAYIVTRKGYSSGALKTANSKGIGLIKIMPDEKFKVVIEFLTADSIARKRQDFPRRTTCALLDADYVSRDESLYGLDNSHCFASLEGMLLHHLRSVKLSN